MRGKEERGGSLILITGRITISIEAVSAILRLIVHSITISIKDLHTAAIYILITYCVSRYPRDFQTVFSH